MTEFDIDRVIRFYQSRTANLNRPKSLASYLRRRALNKTRQLPADPLQKVMASQVRFPILMYVLS